MRACPADYNLVTPRNLQHALQLMNRGGYHPFAGGTDLMVLYEAGALDRRRFVSILGLKELQSIRVGAQAVRIGAGTTYTEILDHPGLAKEFPMLSEAAAMTGAVAIQNRGTIGGNIANASPAADSPPALLAYEARLELASLSGKRIVDYASFHTGYKTTTLQPGELIAAVVLPRVTSRHAIHYYRKVGARNAQAVSKVCFAGLRICGTDIVRIGLGGVSATPLRLKNTEAFLRSRKAIDRAVIAEAQEIARGEISPIDDFRSTAHYRSAVTANLLAEFLSAVR